MKKKTNKTKLDVVFLLDRSGSMHNSVLDTIGGYNGYLNEQRGKDAKITTILFDDKIEELYFRREIDKVKDLTKKEYYVRGCTALYDAIGYTIKKLEKVVDNKVLFIITTDGLENASSEYNKKKISSLINEHDDWEFIYLGANIDSYEEGSSIGIRKDRISNYEQSSKGIAKMFHKISDLCNCVYCDEEIDANWCDGLDEIEELNINNNLEDEKDISW